MFCTSLVNLILKYFILCGSNRNEIFLISFSDCLKCIKTVYYCILILHPATLLSSFTSCNSFRWIPQDFLRSYHLQIAIILLLPFLSGCFCFLFLLNFPG